MPLHDDLADPAIHVGGHVGKDVVLPALAVDLKQVDAVEPVDVEYRGQAVARELALLGRIMAELGLTGIRDPAVALARLRELLPEEAAEMVTKQLVEMSLRGGLP